MKINLRSIDLNLLVVFDAIMTQGNISRAADKIGMSQSAMSHALSRLRATVDDELFVRTPKGLEPTPQARQMADAIHLSLNLITDTLSSSKTFDYADSQRRFRLVLSDYGEVLILPVLLRQLEELAPGIEVEIISAADPSVGDAYLAGKIDLIVSHAPIDSDLLCSTEIYSENLACLVSQSHPYAGGDEISMEDYLEFEHIQLMLTHDKFSLVDRYLQHRGLVRKSRVVVHSLSNMPWMIGSTHLVGTFPEHLAKYYSRHFGLRFIASPFPFEVPVFLMWLRSAEPWTKSSTPSTVATARRAGFGWNCSNGRTMSLHRSVRDRSKSSTGRLPNMTFTSAFLSTDSGRRPRDMVPGQRRNTAMR